MLVTLSSRATETLKRASETLLEGSEKAKLYFNCDTLTIQTVDATWTCTSYYEISNEELNVSCKRKVEPVIFNLRQLYDFLRTPGLYLLRFTWDNEVTVTALRKTLQPVQTPQRLMPVYDNSPYIYPCSAHLHNHVRIHMDANEFANITLDLATGSTKMDVAVFGNSWIVFQSEFETGNIQFASHGFQVDMPQWTRKRRCHQTPVVARAKFIVKFLKLLCGITSICQFMSLYIQTKKPLVAVMELEGKSCLTMCVIPSE